MKMRDLMTSASARSGGRGSTCACGSDEDGQQVSAACVIGGRPVLQRAGWPLPEYHRDLSSLFRFIFPPFACNLKASMCRRRSASLSGASAGAAATPPSAKAAAAALHDCRDRNGIGMHL